MNKIKVIDLFAGCGGLSEGFMQNGNYQFLAHLEWEKAMCDTLKANLMKRWGYSEEEANKSVIQFDIQLINQLFSGIRDDKIKKLYQNNSDQFLNYGLDSIVAENLVDLIIGGPPCQAYSIAGRAQDKDSMKNDYRNYLFESFVAVVNRYRPKFFVFENVPGILSASPGDKLIIDRIYQAFKDIGYFIREPYLLRKSVFSSMHYKVPQDRKRVIIFGVRHEYQDLLEKFYFNLELAANDEIITVKDAIDFLPQYFPLAHSIKLGKRNYSHGLIHSHNVDDHEARYHNLRDINIFKEWLVKNMNQASYEQKIEFYKKWTGKITKHNKYRNLEWDKVSPTIVSHLYKDGLMFIHPDINQLRSITVKEASLLQSFPMDYIFKGSMADKYKMIGNAVPVNFSKTIADVIIKLLKEIY